MFRAVDAEPVVADQCVAFCAASRPRRRVRLLAHWGLGSRLLSDIFLGGADAAEQERFARLQRESATAETAAALLSLV